MARPVTLFTGQWADLPLEELAAKAAGWGFDGLELACWGDHFEVDRALAEPDYVDEKRASCWSATGSGCWALGAHLVGQAVCDPIDDRHEAVLPPEVWGDGDPEGVRRRAAERMKDTARAAAAFGVRRQRVHRLADLAHALLVPAQRLRGDRARLRGLRRALEPDHRRVRPGGRALRARGPPDRDRLRLRHHRARRWTRSAARPGFGINFDPSHFVPQFLDPAAFVDEFADRIYHVHIKDSRSTLDGRRSILGSHLNFGEAERGLGLRLARPRRRRLRVAAAQRSTGSATRGRCRSSGRTRAWTASGAPRTRWRSSARSDFPPRGSSSTKPCAGVMTMSEEQVGFVTRALPRRRRDSRDRRRHARLRASWARRTPTPTRRSRT